jgi:hypothetical protein
MGEDWLNTRRYMRYRVNTPVLIAVPGAIDTVVPGLVSRLSRAGMELYAGVSLQSGDQMEVRFRTTGRTIRVIGTVCSRSGFCYGLEFFALRIELEKAARPWPT